MAEPGSGDSRRARRQRLPEAEVRARMLDTGRDMALEAGVGLSLEDLSMEEIIQSALVPRSSVYRLWPYKDDYLDDLLCYMAGPGSWFAGRDVFDPETFAVVEKTLGDHAHLLATEAGRRAVLCETIRVAVGRNYRAFSGNLEWRIHIALIATVGSSRREARARIAAALEESQSQSRRSMVGLYERAMKTLGLRLRDPERSVEQLVTAGSSLIQGLALRNTLVESTDGTERSTDATDSERLLNAPVPGPGLDGEPADWSLAALAYLAIIDSFLEPDPDFSPTA